LLVALREVLSQALALGGSTPRDCDAHGSAGEFQLNARLARQGQPCLQCETLVRRVMRAAFDVLCHTASARPPPGAGAHGLAHYVATLPQALSADVSRDG
jgi:hypothetical protein